MGVTHASSVTGAILPVKKMKRSVKKRGVPVLVAGAQAMPRMPVDVQDIGCDMSFCHG